MSKSALLISALILSQSYAYGQSISESIPKNPVPTDKYLFYLHGGVVQQQGANAVSQYYGAYKYLDILDSLSAPGIHVISEVRPKNSDEESYAIKVAAQIDSLVRRDVAPENITIVGASLGAYIAVESAIKLRNPKINYAILGLCSEYALEYFSAYRNKLAGNFLSIYEESDEKGSCLPLFSNISEPSHFKEIKLDMGIEHAFLYKPFAEWVHPLLQRIKQS